MKWTPEDDARLAELYSEMPTDAIAQMFGVTCGAVHRRAHRLGVKKNVNKLGGAPLTMKLSDAMRKLLDADADVAGVTAGAVVRRIVCQFYGLKESPRLSPWQRNGGPRKGAGRKPNSFTVYSKPSMPYVPIGRD